MLILVVLVNGQILQKNRQNILLMLELQNPIWWELQLDSSLTGYIPFIVNSGPFATRRVLDQISYLSGAYAENTLNIYGSDPGFTAGHNGGTHTTWEDIALLRSIPEVVIW